MSDGRKMPSDLPALHRRLRQPLLAFFMRRVNDKSEAEDLTQDVFARLAESEQHTSELRNADAYVFQVATNLLRDRGRRQIVRRLGAGALAVSIEGGAATFDSERIAISRERLGAAIAALNELDARRRAIFLLSRLEGFHHQEIAKMHGISPSAVKKHIVKAAAHLAARIGDEP